MNNYKLFTLILFLKSSCYAMEQTPRPANQAAEAPVVQVPNVEQLRAVIACPPTPKKRPSQPRFNPYERPAVARELFPKNSENEKPL